MPRLFHNDISYPYPWKQTALGVLHKYPNPHATHVVSMDTIDQNFDEDTGQLRLERILGVRQGAPRWVVKLLNLSEDTYVREVTVFDPLSSTVHMTSTNLTLSEYLLVKEYITYKPTDSPPSISPSTVFSQNAEIACTASFGGGLLAKAGKKLEDSSYDRFHSNASKGKQGMMTVLRALWGPEKA
ncbi:unnamed protein product [Sympodiomycopsis kandeliae]